jgi:hypothetical protein
MEAVHSSDKSINFDQITRFASQKLEILILGRHSIINIREGQSYKMGIEDDTSRVLKATSQWFFYSQLRNKVHFKRKQELDAINDFRPTTSQSLKDFKLQSFLMGKKWAYDRYTSMVCVYLCVCVCDLCVPLPNFAPVIQFSRNVVWTLCKYMPLQLRIFQFPSQ